MITVLKATVRRGLFSNAYFFSGPSGTGKTTLARIFAMAMLCDHTQDGEPCGVCESCQLFLKDQHYGYTEMDAASVGGKEDMIKLRESAAYSSVSKKKILLIDECHDISPAGQDATLKQLEQCPPHLVYMFCTTDPDKVKQTVKQRCQCFQTSRVDNTLVTGYLKGICEKEGVSYDMPSLQLIAERADGQVRNAVKILEAVLYLGSVTDKNLNVVVRDCDEDIFNIVANLGGDLQQSIQAYRKISSYLSPANLYSKMIELVNDTCKYLYGYDAFLPRRLQMVMKLKEIHGHNLLEFLNYLVMRDKYVDRVSLQSDIIVMHYKFNANNFVVQQRPVQNLKVLPQNNVPQAQTINESAAQTPALITHSDLMKMNEKDRSQTLRDQRRTQKNTQETEGSEKILADWPLPKEERPGEHSMEDDVLSPQEFSQNLVGGRGFGL